MPGPPRGSTFPGSTRRGGGPRGLPRPLPRPFTEQCLLSPEWSCAPGSQPDGFRNRVAAVSALGQPHLCRPALGSPPRRGASPGTPHWRAPSGGPPPAAGRLDAVAEQGSRSVEDIILCLSAHPPQSLALLVSGSKTLTFTAQLRAPGTLLSLDLSS